MFTGPETDRLLIRELIDSYTDAIVRRDGQAWSDTWAPDGTWHIRGREVTGRDNILQLWTSAMAGFRSVVFIASPGMIQVEGDHATGRTHTFEHLEPVNGRSRFQAGVYEDRFVKLDGKWYFGERKFEPREVPL